MKRDDNQDRNRTYNEDRYNNRRNNDRRDNNNRNNNQRDKRQNNNDRGDRKGGNRNRREQGEGGYEMDNIDPNSNYRQFYCRDPEFFLKVMSIEEAPYNMKIHVFPRSGTAPEEWDEIRDQVESDVTEQLKSRGADKDLRVSHVNGPKIRFLFNMNEREDARKLYKDIATKSSYFGQNIAATIFYVKSEQVFCEHADREAKLFYE